MAPMPLRMVGAIAGLAMAAAVGGCAGPGPGLTGNDIGGIIQWTPDNQAYAHQMAGAHCAGYNKYARITSVHAVYGDYISFVCDWRGPTVAVHSIRRHRVVLRTRD
jgi:hypothetical protein